MPDLIDKTNNMMNRIVANKKQETEKIIREMQKRSSNTNKENNTNSNKLNAQKQKVQNNMEKIKKHNDIDVEYEYNEVESDGEIFPEDD